MFWTQFFLKYSLVNSLELVEHLTLFTFWSRTEVSSWSSSAKHQLRCFDLVQKQSFYEQIFGFMDLFHLKRVLPILTDDFLCKFPQFWMKLLTFVSKVLEYWHKQRIIISIFIKSLKLSFIHPHILLNFPQMPFFFSKLITIWKK